MHRDTLLVIPREGAFLVVSPAEGLSAEHTDLNQAYLLLAERRSAGAMPAHRQDLLSRLMPFFIKAATVAVVGAFLLVSAGVAIGYALQEPVKKAGQKAARAVVQQFESGFTSELARTSPEQQARIHQALREAVPHLKPYTDELKPLLQ